jgi:hypothetical protein
MNLNEENLPVFCTVLLFVGGGLARRSSVSDVRLGLLCLGLPGDERTERGGSAKVLVRDQCHRGPASVRTVFRRCSRFCHATGWRGKSRALPGHSRHERNCRSIHSRANACEPAMLRSRRSSHEIAETTRRRRASLLGPAAGQRSTRQSQVRHLLRCGKIRRRSMIRQNMVSYCGSSRFLVGRFEHFFIVRASSQ